MSIKSHQIKILAVLPVTLIFYLLFSMISISISQVLLSISLLCWLILLLTKKTKISCAPFLLGHGRLLHPFTYFFLFIG